MAGGRKWVYVFFFFKQKTAYEIYQCDWSSDVCSSDLLARSGHLRNVEKSDVPGSIYFRPEVCIGHGGIGGSQIYSYYITFFHGMAALFSFSDVELEFPFPAGFP